jgi:Uma2 family endonuclease
MTVVRPDIKFSVEEYRALPETGPRYQLIEGELLMSPAPTYRHQQIVARIMAALLTFVEARRLGSVVASPIDVFLTRHDVLQPDVAFVSIARRAIISREGFQGGPDLVVEALSPSTATLDLGPKRVLYARHGVSEYWIVDPEAGWIDRYRLQENAEKPERRFGEGDSLTTSLLPGFSLDLASVFAA